MAGERLAIVPVDVGNPHAVVLRHALSRDDLLRLGPAVETHPRFPQRTNVQLATPEPRDTVSVLVWERGAGRPRPRARRRSPSPPPRRRAAGATARCA